MQCLSEDRTCVLQEDVTALEKLLGMKRCSEMKAKSTFDTMLFFSWLVLLQYVELSVFPNRDSLHYLH